MSTPVSQTYAVPTPAALSCLHFAVLRSDADFVVTCYTQRQMYAQIILLGPNIFLNVLFFYNIPILRLMVYYWHRLYIITPDNVFLLPVYRYSICVLKVSELITTEVAG